MNLQWFTSPEWANIVKALLHTLWQGAVIAMLLGLALRRMDDAVLRYRSSLAALAGLVLAGLVTWAVLNRPVAHPVSTSPAPSVQSDSVPLPETVSTTLVVNFPPPQPKPVVLGWTAWMALVWLAGMTLMIGRAGFQVAGAERLRRTSQPLADARIVELLAEARQAVGLIRRVRLAVTDRLTSPAVVGVLVPTLILPLSLTTTLTAEQIRFILLHELAHIRRGDYFANLFQLFAEALLFFNPAVWWISRQMRLEREACCDALAIELSGAPADYARTLVHVAENILSPGPAAAAAFGDQREPSSLADRVQRMLVPGYRPRLRLTWRAMLAALFVGGALLTLSAIGTRVTVAAILSPEQRINRIEKKMIEFGERPEVQEFGASDEQAPKVTVSGSIRTADGTPVPKWVQVNVNSSTKHSSYGAAFMVKDGDFTTTTRAGTIYLTAQVAGYALSMLGPLDGFATNVFTNQVIVLERGFDVPVQVVDADSGKFLPGATMSAMFWLNNNGYQAHVSKAGEDGSVSLTHCADLPLDVTVNVAGYEITQKKYTHVSTNEPLRVALRRGDSLSGTITDKVTGQPLAGAEIHLLYQTGGETPGRFRWDDSMYRLGKSDSAGAFTLDQLRHGIRYYLGVSAAGHESVICENINAGTSNLAVQLGPELIVHGHVTSGVGQLEQFGHDRMLNLSTSEVYDRNSYGDGQQVRVLVTNGVGTFVFTNRTAGKVTLSGAGYSEERDLAAPIDDWEVKISETRKTVAEFMPKREVIFRFKHPSGVAPRGIVAIEIPDNLELNHLTAHEQEMMITNGEAHAEIAIGGRTSIRAKQMVGYWFNNWGENGHLLSIQVTNGNGPMLIEIPLVPAGAIYAKARNADGTAAGGLMFGVSELKRSPNREANSALVDNGDGFSGNAARKWVSEPLPLGGTYQIYASRGNSFCVGEPIKLTEANPDAESELQFRTGKSFAGVLLDADGRPLRDVEVKVLFKLADEHLFGLNSVFTDKAGRFQLDDMTPDLGEYSVEADVPGIMAESVKLNFGTQPQSIRLKRGHTLAGHVVEGSTGLPIPGMEVRALDYDSNKLPMLTTHTDADGRFEFTGLGDVNYTLYPDGGELLDRPASGNKTFRADGRTNLTLRVKLYAWSTVKPKTVATRLTNTLHAAVDENHSSNPVNTGTRTVIAQRLTNTNDDRPSVLITAKFYEVNGDTKSPESAGTSVVFYQQSPEEFDRFKTALKAEKASVISAPRIVTLSGEEADMQMIGKTNMVSLSCRPVVTNGQVWLDWSGQMTNAGAGAITINRSGRKAVLENHGGLVVYLQNASNWSGSNLVATIGVEIITSAMQEQFRQRAQSGAVATNTPVTVADENHSLNHVTTGTRTVIAPGLTNTNVARTSVLITADMYALSTADYRKLVAEPEAVNISTGTSFIGSVSAARAADFDQKIKSLGLSPFHRPRLQTSDGMSAEFFSGDKLAINDVTLKGVELDCLPYIGERAVDLVYYIKAVGDLTGAGMVYGKGKQAFNGRNEVEDGGRLMICPNDPDGPIQTNLVVVLGVQILTNTMASPSQPKQQKFVRQPDGTIVTAEANATNLLTRTFKVDDQIFISSLKRVGLELAEKTNSPAALSAAVRKYFANVGVDWESPAGKAVFYNERNGMLLVRAPKPDLDIVEQAVEILNQMSPQIHIKARFMKVPPGTVAGLGSSLNQTNSADSSFNGILDAAKARTVLRSLASLKDAETLAEPEATTTSGRQVQMRATQLITVVSNFVFQQSVSNNQPSAIIPQMNQVETGPILDVIPYVQADGYAINLTVIPSLIEFLGYATPPDVPNFTGTNNRVQLPVVLPQFNKRQAMANLSVWDGETVVIGGLPEVNHFTHKTPVLGSVPLMGRLFQSDHATTNEILVLVTATIVDPAGNRVHNDKEMAELAGKIPPPAAVK